MRENEIPLERVISEELPDINDQENLSEIEVSESELSFEKVDISDLWDDNIADSKRKPDHRRPKQQVQTTQNFVKDPAVQL